ncbi:DUF7289 family protein [Halobaculum lipolyticum]|uniref:DUF7305 domain-containing protein n=1 Tax=Halobaculum lipolyticum TaxID=3032001 RepID=A0ABD5W8M8_9EURY|nr:hypothetical protein [Halobaculum sp. DT31]
MYPGGKSGDRGQSEVIGFVLLIGLVAVGVTGVVALGGTAIDATQDRAAFDNAELAMSEFDSRTGVVALGGTGVNRVRFPTTDSGDVSVRGDAGSLRFEVTNRSTGAVAMNESMPLGAVVYEQGERSLAYQGGGVWALDESGNARMVSPPEFHYRVRDGRDPTLTLPIVTVRGNATGGRTALVSSAGSSTLFPEYGNESLDNPLEQGLVNVTVESRYYRAWGDYMETRTSGNVSYDHDAHTVTLTLVSPQEPRTVENAIASGSQSVVIQGGTDVDSYNSSEGPYVSGSPCPPGSNASVYVVEDLELSGDSTVCGDMYVDGDLDIGGGIVVRGDLIVNGDLTFGGGAGTVDADLIVATGTLDMAGGVTLQSDTVVGGTVSEGGGVTVTSDVRTGGRYLAGSGTLTDTGSVHAADDYVPANGQNVEGTVRTAGVYDDDSVYPNDGSATIVEGAAGPDLSDLERARDLTPPNFGSIDNEIDSKLAETTASNDNGDESGDIADVESGNCWGTCTLDAGSYALEEVDVGGDLVLNTTEGPVTLAVEGDFDVGGGGEIRVIGDGAVEVYVGGDAPISGRLVTASGRGDQVTIYGDSESSVSLSSATVYGVLYAPGNDEISMSGGSELYGAIVGTVTSARGGSVIHYDEALRSREAIDTTNDAYPELTYVHVSVNNVTVSSG